MKTLKNFWVEFDGEQRFLVYPPVHDRDMVLFLVGKGLPCLRPGCGCTEWWED